MNPDILSNEIIRRKKRNQRRNALLMAMALLATLVTAYILLIPAFTQEKINLSLDCTVDFHHHTEDCYTESGELICGYADYVIHQHNDLCYDNGGSLICTLPESEDHIHSDSCYTQIKTLICTVGDEEHIHDESCYKIENVLSCGKDELHTHTEECYDENNNLICGKLELKKHTHDAQCLKEVQEESSTDESSDETVNEMINQSSVVPKVKVPLKAPLSNSGSGTTVTAADGSILASDTSLNNAIKKTANAWQITDKQYTGNNPDNKISSPDGSVRVQKNVIPTDKEDEFLVYLSIDTKQMFSQYFKTADYQATTSNNWTVGAIQKIGGSSVKVSASSSSGYKNSATFTFKDADGNVIYNNLTLYWDKANNISFYISLSTGELCIGTRITNGSKNNIVQFTQDAQEEVFEEIMKVQSLNKVEDLMGEHIQFMNVIAGDYENTPECTDKKLVWYPKFKTTPQRNEIKESSTTIYWNLNVAELVYKVHLDMNKVAQEYNSDMPYDWNTEYNVNQSAKLYYGNEQTMEFPVPKVKGNLYYIQLTKTDDKDSSKLLGEAEFTLNGTDNFGNSILQTLTTTNQGLAVTKALPSGTYTLTETTAPSGYELDSTPIQCTLSATENQNDIFTYSEKSYIGKTLTVTNSKINLCVVNMIKTADGDVNSPLSNAEFTLLCTAGENAGKYYSSDGTNTNWTENADYKIISDSNGKFSVTVPNGTYILTETKTPDGYYTTDTWTLSINNNLIDSFVATSTNNAVEKNGGDYNISNKSGKILPSTGGTGTNICITGGVLIIALTLLWRYIIGKKQKNS